MPKHGRLPCILHRDKRFTYVGYSIALLELTKCSNHTSNITVVCVIRMGHPLGKSSRTVSGRRVIEVYSLIRCKLELFKRDRTIPPNHKSEDFFDQSGSEAFASHHSSVRYCYASKFVLHFCHHPEAYHPASFLAKKSGAR